MSVWTWMALYSLTFLTGTERCELRYLDVKGGSITAVGSSPNGRYHLAKTSPVGKLTAVVMWDDQRANWEIRGPNIADLVGIDDSGTILGHYHARVYSGGMIRTFLYREGKVVTAPFTQEPERFDLGFMPMGIGSDGEVFGGYYGKMPDLYGKEFHQHASAAVAWKNGNYQVYAHDLVLGPSIVAVARTERGVVGYVPRWTIDTPTRRSASGVLPVYFSGGRGVAPLKLPLPKDVVEAMPLFANASGSLILARGTTSAGIPVPVIWQNDVPMVPTMGRKWSNATLKSGTVDGMKAVGSMPDGRVMTAVIWEDQKGVRPLEEVARKRGVMIPAGWRLIDAVSISPDGNRVFGTAATRKDVRKPFLLWLGPRPRKAAK